MSDGDFFNLAGGGAQGSASRAVDRPALPMPFCDWVELGRQILAEAARRAIAEEVGGNARCSARESAGRSDGKLIAEGRA